MPKGNHWVSVFNYISTSTQVDETFLGSYNYLLLLFRSDLEDSNMATQNVDNLIQAIASKGQSFKPDDEAARQALLRDAKSLVSSLESPAERLAVICYQEVCRRAPAHCALVLGQG